MSNSAAVCAPAARRDGDEIRKIHWLSAAEIAAMALPGLPGTARGIQRLADEKGWTAPEREGATWRAREGRGGGMEFSSAALPLAAQAALLLRLQGQATAGQANGQAAETSERWAWFERQTDKTKERARERLRIVQAVHALMSEAHGVNAAVNMVSAIEGRGKTQIFEWLALVRHVPRPDWLPHLAPGHGGGRGAAECPPEAMRVLLSDYLRPAKPNLSDCLRRLRLRAAAEGWALPSDSTLTRSVMALPETQRILLRDGEDALKRRLPAQRRDRGVFHALEAVNADGHTWDVFVKWPDGTTGRPNMVAFQDLYSGKVLSWRIDQSLSWHGVRLAFGDVVESFGIPRLCWLDNGREFAAKRITGGQKNRYRFKLKEEEPEGLLTALGVEVHWATPYHGQAKPIERAFRDFAGSIAKHPALAGAYTGNSPMAKPADYGSRAVPLEQFLAVIAEGIAEHNARAGRRSPTCAGRSFDATFAESYARVPVMKPTEEQRRLWLLAADGVTIRRQDGKIALYGNEYYADFLREHMGSKATVRFDPLKLDQAVHVYALDGRYLGAAEPWLMAGFNSVEDAQKHGRLTREIIRGEKRKAELLNLMKPSELARDLPRIEAAEPPEAKVVRPFLPTHGNTARKPMPVAEADAEEEDRLIAAMRAAGPPKFRVVSDEED